MTLSDFDYQLPEALVAQEPVTPRDASRLRVVQRGGAGIEHAHVRDLDRFLAPGDLLVFNDTRVFAARLLGRKATGGRCELLLIEPIDTEGGARWRAIFQASKGLRPGARLSFGALEAEVEGVERDGFVAVRFDRAGAALAEAVDREGRIPLPPYIRRDANDADRDRYQTIFARTRGSVAAPTAGLHFTEDLLARLAERGIARAAVTLHVGPGTFLPIRGEDVEQHRMHEERYEVPAATVEAFDACRRRGGRVVAVGTTAVRTLESAWHDTESSRGDDPRRGALRPGPGRTSIFIRPPYRFRAIDALVTNLHLPRSTLLMLVCAFAGRDRVLACYREAVSSGYRFFSYGDAMLFL